MFKTITAQDAYDWLRKGDAVLIDVREADEFADRHIPYAQSVPLSLFPDALSALHFPEGQKVIVHCLKGKRGEKACAVFSDNEKTIERFNIDGGIEAWENAGFPIIFSKSAQPKISIFRQVQIIIGGLIAMLIAFGFLGVTLAFVLAGIFATALMVAGITGWCGLSILLQKMPWNRKRT